MTNKEKFLSLVSEDTSNTLDWMRENRKKRQLLSASSKIAINILQRLDQLGWKQKDLAEKMGVKAQQISKWVRGGENYSLETLLNLGQVLGIDLIEVKPVQPAIVIAKKTVEVLPYEKTRCKIIPITYGSTINIPTEKYERAAAN